MTLQVGLVGSDGVVLASDRLVNTSDQGGAIFKKTNKFIVSKDVVCCWSEDEVGRAAASRIRDLEWSQAATDAGLRSCANEAWASKFPNPIPDSRAWPRKVLVAFLSNCSLWEVEVRPDAFVKQILDRTIVGSMRSTAQHLTNNYFPDSPQPVERLIFLAAYTILMGAREDGASIAGLQIAILLKGEQPRFLSNAEELELTQRSDQMYKSLKQELLRKFALRPATPPQA